MHILMIGGTRFIGRHVVEAALAAGRDRDRDGDLSALADGEWDATVDTCAYVPRQVHELADVLGDRGGHHLLVSSVTAYASPTGPGLTEDAPLAEFDDPTVEEVTNETYGGLKVLCERAAVDRYGPRTLLVRPTYVVGPDDYSWRFPWWVARMARGGEVLAPGPDDAPAQVIDVRDMASWMVGPEPVFTWRQQLTAMAAAVAPEGSTLTWVDADFVHSAGLPEGALPLWSGDDPGVWTMAADPAKAYGTGLSPRPLVDTARDTLAWIRTVEQPAGVGLDPDREAELLAAWHARA